MATVAITVHVEDTDLAEHVASRLGWEVEDITGQDVRLVTDEPTFVARMLGDFWSDYADVLEGEAEPLMHERYADDIEQTANDVLAALERDRS